MAFRLLALAVPDPLKMEIKIAYPERDIMECTLVVIVFSVNAGKVIKGWFPYDRKRSQTIARRPVSK